MSSASNELALGPRLKTLRAQKGWSQVELAEAASMTQSAISRLEQGIVQQPRLKGLDSLAKALGTTVDYLVGRTDTVSVSRAMVSDAAVLELVQTYQHLHGSRQQQLLEYAHFLKLQESKSSRKKHA